ncbi:MAG: 2'-5' RNA ligase family protein [Candidatus Wildermuthbacteria bacterium]|nr:2'-5' RNA ligase family protein [Candidatus Wildermuthbacteria bacterium]
MRHRVFIAINLPEDIKKKLADYESRWPELPVRWTKKDNLHLTLAFLGSLTDEELLEVCKTTKEVASRHEPFFINLTKIIYGPPKSTPRSMSSSNSFPRSSRSSAEGGTPRMVWVEGERSEELKKLQNDLEKTLGSAEGNDYTPHLTLGRLKQWEFQVIEPAERPEINEEINLSFEVNSIEVMESELKRTGPEYAVLESCPLKTGDEVATSSSSAFFIR